MAKEIVRAEDSFKLDANNTNQSATGILPSIPWVEIQFRTNITEESNLNKITPSSKNEWTTVTSRAASDTYSVPLKQGDESSLRFDNYFENVTLEDSGGVINCQLQLFDKDLERLENIIIKSMVAVKGGNEIAMNSLAKATPKAVLEFMPNPSSNINFRIRFGYSDPGGGTDVYRPALKSSPEWKARTTNSKKGSLYIKSPWTYFMMMGLEFNLTQKGMSADVKGVSISNSFLDKTKIIKRFALMKGTPKKLFNGIARQIYSATGGRVQVVQGVLAGSTSSAPSKPILPNDVTSALGSNVDYGVPSDLPIQWAVSSKEGASKTYPRSLTRAQRKDLEESAKWLNISLSLGGEPRYETSANGEMTGKIINEFMSLKNLLNDFVSKVPCILRNKNTNKYITDAEVVKKIMDNTTKKYDSTAFEPIKYTYSINEQTTDLGDGAITDTIVIIRFFYRRLDNTKQGFVRSYDYMQSPTSLIKNFNVKNSLDFVQLNQSIVVKGENLDALISAPNKETDNNQGSAPADITSALTDKINNGSFSLVNKIVEDNGEGGANVIATKVVQNMNDGIFTGTIEILGDPFFMFDSSLQPFQYYIKINVYRSYNEYSKSSNKKILSQSYLTGYYLIKKITHNINASGFKTILEVQRYPTTGIET